MKVALLSTDNREHYKRYEVATPIIPVPQEALLQGMYACPGLEVHVISCVRVKMRSFEQLAENIWYHSLYVPKAGWLSSAYLGCIHSVKAKLKELQVDIVHGQGTERDCGISAAFSGRPNVVTIHGNMAAVAKLHTKGKDWFYHWCVAKLETLTLRRTMGVFCNSSYTAEQVASRTRKTWHVPNALRLPFFSPEMTGARATPPLLLNVGVISDLKRQIELLDIAEKLFSRGYRFRLQFVGALDQNSSYGRDFLARLRIAETAGYAEYLGEKSTGELIRYLDAASALIHFSREESFGLVIAEALARNLKLFATRVGGVVDIAEGVDGAELFVDERRHEMGDSIGRWIEEGTPLPGSAAAEMRRRYHPQVVAERHIEIYREVLSTCL